MLNLLLSPVCSGGGSSFGIFNSPAMLSGETRQILQERAALTITSRTTFTSVRERTETIGDSLVSIGEQLVSTQAAIQ
jgi:hypothetical protein